MSQPYDNTLVVTSRIGGFLVKRVMIDQGSGAEIVYPDLYKGLGLKPKDLSKYDTPLVRFDGKIVVPEGQIRLPIVTNGKEVMVFSNRIEIPNRRSSGILLSLVQNFDVSLQIEDQVEILLSLVQNFDVFAWSPYKLPEVNLAFISHKLNADPLMPLKKQKLRRSSKPHIEAVKEKVEKLKKARAIKEVFFPKWLSNTIVVKTNGKWRVYVDFTDLN
ncbi:uncharacterized protein LOC142605798 [Castanea sativa]|uniref:uncharacterized protein LOC142605798 n=1 Tax=Castanea sativa TaxID=21020 RepID=UPI003F652089